MMVSKEKMVASLKLVEAQIPDHAIVVIAVPFGVSFGQCAFVSNANVAGVNAAAQHLVQATGGVRDSKAVLQ